MDAVERARRLGGDMEAAFGSIGLSMLPADLAAKLLAWVYCMGGGDETVTHHERIAADVAAAQRKFRIVGGERPDARGAALVRARVRELEAGGDATPWLREIYDRYGIGRHPA